MFAKPQTEHKWLDQLVGQWSFEHVCTMPDGSMSKTPGTMTCRSLGGLWLICESHGQSSEGEWSSIMTLGLSVQELANTATRLRLSTKTTGCLPVSTKARKATGSRLCQANTGGVFRNARLCHITDEILMTSRIQGDDGKWITFMSGTATRKEH